MATVGRFTVEGDLRRTFYAVVQSCKDIANVHDINTAKWMVRGKTKTNWREWGHEYYVQLHEGTGEVTVEVYDLYPVLGGWDYFIKELHRLLLAKLKVTSNLVVDTAEKAEIEEDKDARPEKPLDAEGPPLLVADIPDDTGPKTLPSHTTRACPSCGAEVPQDSSMCQKCNAPLPRACRACGAAPPSWAQFCNSCGAKL